MSERWQQKTLMERWKDAKKEVQEALADDSGETADGSWIDVSEPDPQDDDELAFTCDDELVWVSRTFGGMYISTDGRWFIKGLDGLLYEIFN